jgi:transcriptional regulator with XRE-family HTH domain
VDPLVDSIARRLRVERVARGWSLGELAERSRVSRAMISKVERGEASPTATVLGRLSGAFGLTLSTLLARAEVQGPGVLRAADQPTWRDPDSGYLRRSLVKTPGLPLELTEVELPSGAEVAFPRSTYTFVRHVIWVISGRLDFDEGEDRHVLRAGDSLVLGPPRDCVFRNPGRRTCRYLVAVLRP